MNVRPDFPHVAESRALVDARTWGVLGLLFVIAAPVVGVFAWTSSVAIRARPTFPIEVSVVTLECLSQVVVGTLVVLGCLAIRWRIGLSMHAGRAAFAASVVVPLGLAVATLVMWTAYRRLAWAGSDQIRSFMIVPKWFSDYGILMAVPVWGALGFAVARLMGPVMRAENTNRENHAA